MRKQGSYAPNCMIKFVDCPRTGAQSGPKKGSNAGSLFKQARYNIVIFTIFIVCNQIKMF